MKNSYKGLGLYFLVIASLLAIFAFTGNHWLGGKDPGPLSDAEVFDYLEKGQVTRVELETIKVGSAEMGNARLTIKEGEKESVRSFYVSNIADFRQYLHEHYPQTPVYADEVKEDSIWAEILPMLLITVVVIILMMFLMSRLQGGGSGGQMMNFGKARTQVANGKDNPIRFRDVAGLEEEKEEMQEVVDFLRDPRKYSRLGARIPKGVMLVGPPGTGKTYLAKAVAGEAGVPFFTISGSDFVEMFVGVGASRVRDLFDQAKRNAPSIVFIDEIDAVGRHRGAGLGGGHDEREQTLNQLLVEMDGFAPNQGVIVMAATNRVDILDPALLRPGRFDRQIVVGRPDVKGREDVLRIHAMNKPLGDDVDLHVVAQTTAGFTPADLENLLNEAAILAARDNQNFINMKNIQAAFVKVGIGTEKKSHIISDKEKRVTAYHEAGHANIHHVIDELDPVHSISIIPTGLAGGYTMSISDEDSMYLTKSRMESEIVSLLGGRTAEELILKDVTTGASNDIERATSLARSMVTKYGMSDRLGLIQFGEESDEVFLGKDIGHKRNYGEQVAGAIDEEIRSIIDTAHVRAEEILKEHLDILHETAALLLEKEKITGAEFAALFNKEEPKAEGENTTHEE